MRNQTAIAIQDRGATGFRGEGPPGDDDGPASVSGAVAASTGSDASASPRRAWAASAALAYRSGGSLLKSLSRTASQAFGTPAATELGAGCCWLRCAVR